MRPQQISTKLKRGVAGVAISAAALGAVVGVDSTPASAIPLVGTLTSVTCSGSPVYGSTFSCTISVVSLNVFSTNRPTGTASLGTLLGRLSTTSCTLAPAAATRTSSCTVTPTALDTGIVFPGATYSGSSTYIPSVGLMISPVLGLTIAPAPLTITANDDSRAYGDPDPALTAEYDGFVLGDDETDLLGTLACSTTADAASLPNGYPINCSGLSSPNSAIIPFTPHYTITWVPGTLTVGKQALDITAKDVTRIYGDANPTFEVEYSAFAAGDDEGDLGGTLNCTTVADENSPVGEYDIECDGLTSDAYDITFHKGTLTVLSSPDAELPGGSGAVAPNQQVIIDVSGWEPDSTVHVDACGVFSGEIVADENGNGQGVFTLPADFNLLECEITLTGDDQVGNPAEVVLSLSVALPAAGGNPLPLGMTALFTCFAGAALLLASRRRIAFRR